MEKRERDGGGGRDLRAFGSVSDIAERRRGGGGWMCGGWEMGLGKLERDSEGFVGLGEVVEREGCGAGCGGGREGMEGGFELGVAG